MPQGKSTAQPTPGPGGQVIVLEAPAPNATMGSGGSPVQVRGRVTVSPFEAQLRGRVYDAAGTVIGEGPIHVQAEMGQPGPFAGAIPLRAAAHGAGRVEVADISPRDGAVLASASVPVRLGQS